ncbi:copper amine oxidase N-terminal domain-containing protein [Paenibacillus tritici]|uniref:copper amine oxidase N-terminal domain-containing protein n=1 Tax=Paenibacillus tritici TaxID=1873425 RepID=UPI001BA62E89|nr:copper amine oxidase N-terminal domain-containing protein [Paenibacillus tritici]QUL53228.1 copper amine oxidase N-terminal domain-containing protein [Paenibacillus tritici]
MNKYLKNGFIGALIASLLIAGNALNTGSASAASSTIGIRINNSFADTDVATYITNGTTMVPLQVAQQIPGSSVQWNNSSKTVTLTRNGEITTLVAGQKTAKIENKEVKLEAASTLKQGRVMVPLRFIAESTGAYVLWNPKQRVVFVAKPNKELKEQLASSSLAEARTAALKFPRVSSLEAFKITDNEGGNQEYYFPEGKADQFFLSGGNGISYYVVAGNHSEEKWTATFNSESGSNGLFFLLRKITNQDGELPKITSRIVFFHFMGHVGEANYGFIEPNGKVSTLGTKGMELNQFFDIPEEKKS